MKGSRAVDSERLRGAASTKGKKEVLGVERKKGKVWMVEHRDSFRF